MDYDDFTEDQKNVIEHGKGALLVEAGPGSGKTTVIVDRIKHIIKTKEESGAEVDPSSFLVITFTNKATDNLKYKLRKEFSNDFVSKMQISTIHSFCLEYLKNLCSNKEKYSALTLIDDDASEKKTLFIQKYKRHLGFKKEYTVLDYQIPAVVAKFGEYAGFKVDTDELINYIHETREISPAYIKFVNSLRYFSKKRLEDYDKLINDLKKKNPDELTEEEMECEGIKKSWYNATYLQIARAYPKYLELLDENNYVDYNTLQFKTLEELKEDSNHPYKVIFVDEFQDTDPLQFRIFKILNKTCDYFTAVGDVDQHIYAFRSSFNDFFDEFKRLEEGDYTSLPLNVNFRSTENIVKLTEEFIDEQRKDDSKKSMKNHRTDCNNPNLLIENESSIGEANTIYGIIKFLKENNKINDYSDVAILYRKHSDDTITHLIDKFNENDIEFSVKGRKDLSDQNEVQTLLTLMWYISRNTDFGYVPSKGELKELNLKALCGEYFETSFFSFDDSTKEYLCKLQDSYYIDVTKKEYKLLGKEKSLSGKDDEFLINKARNLKNRVASTQDFLDELFKDLQMPIVDIDKITNPTDKEFFKHLENIRDEIESKNSQTTEISEGGDVIASQNENNEDEKKKEPLTILGVFYKLIALSNLYEYELNYKEIANLAILTQTISNYESFISETNFRGVFYFLSSAIENYDSYQKEGNGVKLMTIHAAKGLEFPVTIITSLEKEKFPPKVKDPNREMDHINGSATYYTPNECLTYKTIVNEDGECEILTIEEENRRDMEEEDRVLYVAMTRAEDLLILSTIGDIPDQIDKIREHTVDFSFNELAEVEIPSAYEDAEEEKEMEDELESLEEPVVLNYSKYTQYISCPFKYDLSNNLGFRRTGSAKAANRGTVFHEIMEKVNLRLIEGSPVSEEELETITFDLYNSMFDIKKLYSSPMEDLKDEDKKKINDFEEFKSNVIDYYKNYSLERETLEAEFDFELFIDNYILNGSIDLIYRDSDGELVILDYKYAKFKEGHIDGYIKQSYIYALALSKVPEYNKLIKKAIIHFVLGDGESDEPYAYEVEIKKETLEEELEKITEVSQKIKEGIFEKEPKKLEECAQCSYRTFCKPKEYAHELYDK